MISIFTDELITELIGSYYLEKGLKPDMARKILGIIIKSRSEVEFSDGYNPGRAQAINEAFGSFDLDGMSISVIGESMFDCLCVLMQEELLSENNA